MVLGKVKVEGLGEVFLEATAKPAEAPG